MAIVIKLGEGAAPFLLQVNEKVCLSLTKVLTMVVVLQGHISDFQTTLLYY